MKQAKYSEFPSDSKQIAQKLKTLKCNGRADCTNKPTVFIANSKSSVCVFCYNQLTTGTSQVAIDRLMQLNPKDILQRLNPKINTGDLQSQIDKTIDQISKGLDDIKNGLIKSVRCKFGADPSVKALKIAQDITKAKTTVFIQGSELAGFGQLNNAQHSYVDELKQLKSKNMEEVKSRIQKQFGNRSKNFQQAVRQFASLIHDINEDVFDKVQTKKKRKVQSQQQESPVKQKKKQRK